MVYFITPDYSVALNTKVGSSTLALAIIQAHHPVMWQKLRDAAYPPGIGPEDLRWHSRCPREAEPTKPVVLAVRDPVDRFLSACAQVNVQDVDRALDSLENANEIPRQARRKLILQTNEHFTFQHRLPYGETHIFRFPDHLEQLAKLIGVAWPLPVINENALRPKPTLLKSQRARVEDYYAKDIELFESILAPDTVITMDPEARNPKPKEPVPAQVYPTQLRLWLIDHGISMSQVDSVLAAVPEEKTREKLKVKWEFASMIDRADPAINQLGAALGFKPSQIDQAFREAILL